MAVRTGTEFTSAWEEFTRAIRRARGRASGPLEGSGLTLAQFQLLEGLRSAGELTVSELAVGAGVAVPTATRMLDGLVRAGRPSTTAARWSSRSLPTAPRP
jgi:DNA-binding MarR family transcriptional regulator